MVTNSTGETSGIPGHGAVPDNAVALHATVTGSGPRAVLLHGLFGMGSNLGGIARHLAKDYEVHQLDLPNHGRSAWTGTTTIPDQAHAVAAYLEAEGGASSVLLGHSLGGKVVMELAMSRPELATALVIADIAPVPYEPSHAAVFAAIESVARACPATRNDAATIMRRHLKEENVVQFLLLSLHRRGASYGWRFNADVLRQGYESLLAAPSSGHYGGPVLLVHGEQSTYVDSEGKAMARLRFPDLAVASIAGTGHWLHVERRDEFNGVVDSFLRQHKSAESPL